MRSLSVYVVLAAGIWLAFLKSGVHPTVAGVLLGLLTPARPGPGGACCSTWSATCTPACAASSAGLPHAPPEAVSARGTAGARAAPLGGLRHHAGVRPGQRRRERSSAGVLANRRSPWRVAAGLVLGKPLGIVLFSWASVRTGL